VTRKRVVVLGDAMADVWADFRTTRPSPEDSRVPVVEHVRTTVMLGGALNVAASLAAYPRLEVMYCDLDMAFSGSTMSLLREAGVHYRHGAIPSGRVTMKRRVRVDGRVVMRHDRDFAPQYPISADGLRGDLNEYQPNAIVLVDYGKGALWPPTLTRAVLDWWQSPANSNGELLMLDAKPPLHACMMSHPALDEWCVLKCNESEMRAFVPNVVDWHQATGGATCIVTRGEQGATVRGHGVYWHADMPAVMLPPKSVCGAGDVVTAAIVGEMLGGASPDVAAMRAVRLASQLCATRTDTLTLTRADVDPDSVSADTPPADTRCCA
jgi:bifunctional ADP-heptose synthase (sugar kinase/adenylyltransferase)